MAVHVTAEQARELGISDGPKWSKNKAAWLAQYRATPRRPMEVSSDLAEQRALFDVHAPATYRLWLPLAPSANATKKIQMHPSQRKAWLADTAAAGAYRIAVAEFWDAHWNHQPPEPLTGRIAIYFTVHLTRRGGDIFNREKALCDALTACGCWVDDAQIDAGGVLRGRVLPPTGAMDVIIEATGH